MMMTILRPCRDDRVDCGPLDVRFGSVRAMPCGAGWLRLAAAALLLAAGCGAEEDRAPSAGNHAAPTEAAVDTVVRAAHLRYLAGFDDEGVLEAPMDSPSAPGPHYVAGTLYADAAAVAALLAPDSAVGEAGGVLTLAGRGTGIPVRRYGAAVYAPVRELARRLGAYTREAEGDATVWPRERLCEYLARRPDPRAAVYRGALAAGLFAGCPAGAG